MQESRFKDRGLGTIKVDERGGAEAGAAGGVGCLTSVASAMAQGIDCTSSEATSGGKAGA